MSIGSKLYRTQRCANSMEWAKEHILTAPDGAVFIADQLESAQGRQGRTWNIYPGQLLVTFILKPAALATFCADDLPIRLNQLNMALTIGILEPLLAYHAHLKWPNDFIINGKKIGGLLLQLVWHGEKAVGVIAGFGLNVTTHFEATDPLAPIATSIADEGHKDCALRPLYHQLLTSLNKAYQQWNTQQFDVIYKTWRTHQYFLSKTITVHQKDETVISGRLTQVLPNGDAMIEQAPKAQLIIPFYNVETVSATIE